MTVEELITFLTQYESERTVYVNGLYMEATNVYVDNDGDVVINGDVDVS